jgi:hypothetical protein
MTRWNIGDTKPVAGTAIPDGYRERQHESRWTQTRKLGYLCIWSVWQRTRETLSASTELNISPREHRFLLMLRSNELAQTRQKLDARHGVWLPRCHDYIVNVRRARHLASRRNFWTKGSPVWITYPPPRPPFEIRLYLFEDNGVRSFADIVTLQNRLNRLQCSLHPLFSPIST